MPTPGATRLNTIFTPNSLLLNTKRTPVVLHYTQIDSCNDRLTPVLRVPVRPSKDISATMNRTTVGEPVREEASLPGEQPVEVASCRIGEYIRWEPRPPGDNLLLSPPGGQSL